MLSFHVHSVLKRRLDKIKLNEARNENAMELQS